MYAFHSAKDSPTRYTPHVLPCRIHHDGPIESTERFWAPQPDKDGTQTAHFRGRRLRGRRVPLPDGYRGVIATPTDRVMTPASQRPDHHNAEAEDPNAEPEEPVKALEMRGTFADLMVWGHETAPAADDAYVKGVQEWLQLAETVAHPSHRPPQLISLYLPLSLSLFPSPRLGRQILEMPPSDPAKVAPEALISQFQVDKLLKQDPPSDQNGRRIALLGTIDSQQGILIAERAAFATESLEVLRAFHAAIGQVKNLGDNDIYRWYLASSSSFEPQPDLKINLIWPCTQSHIKKYSDQQLRMVTETPAIYRDHVQPYMRAKREQGRLNWVFNILEGRTEQEDVIMRDAGHGPEDAFLMLPDLNWDRKTMGSLHLLALVHRRDIWSLRDLKKSHVPWLRYLRQRVLEATVKMYPGLEADQLKLYVHYQPTYYHFHIHVVNVMLEAGATQATGKAFGLENLISQLETMAGDDEASMAEVSLTYYLGEASELWTEIFAPLKNKG
ncbi:hypothetical protein N7510_000068 [Penicillium lagena]|uniref:uncharacterized protein n=1 Tax=Penicillium lagena TaxID=94218 RepID=UPI002541B394|nr:uncharacterized protein N7510_000068 [Penicillium lagena]KAJ5623759.1 hypothetical protein N7510_000068 [Penicillium lagena]